MFFVHALWISVALNSVHQAASQYEFSLKGACPPGMVRTSPKCFCSGGRRYSTDNYCVRELCPEFFHCTPLNSHCDGQRCYCTTEGYIYVSTVNELDCVPLCISDCGQVKSCDGRGICTCPLSSEGVCVLITCPTQGSNFDSYCKGICETNCKNGECDSYGTCTCHHGFYKEKTDGYTCNKIFCPSSAGFCLQQCAEKCRNGRCDRNGICRCDDGFNKDTYDDFKCNKIACPSENIFCSQLCSANCENGDCNINGDCDCNVGFHKATNNDYKCEEILCPSSSGYCLLQCKERCRNGECNGNGVCQCNVGYHLDVNDLYNCKEIFCPSSNGYCLQKCKENCQNGNCIRGGVCQCEFGFKNDAKEVDKCNNICPSNQRNDFCRQKCETNCTNGSCDPTGRCLCNTGFIKNPKDVCIPIACPDSKQQTYCLNFECTKNGCENGKCNKGMCTCNQGFEKSLNNSNKCQRIRKLITIADVPCPSKCLFGVCVDGRCFCKEGYKLDRAGNETETCRPICSEDCADNEVCSSPENCTCVEGFYFDEDRKCVPKCRVACAGGFCIGQDQCRCHEGFVKLNGTFCRKEEVKIEGGSVNEEANSKDGSVNIAWIVSGTVVFVVAAVCFCFIVRLVVKKRKKRASDIKECEASRLRKTPPQSKKMNAEDGERSLPRTPRQDDGHRLDESFKPTMQPEAHYQSAATHEYLELLPENVYANVENMKGGIYTEINPPSVMQMQHVDYETPLAAGSPLYDRPYDHVCPKMGQTHPLATPLSAQELQVPTFYAPVPPSKSQIRQLRE